MKGVKAVFKGKEVGRIRWSQAGKDRMGCPSPTSEAVSQIEKTHFLARGRGGWVEKI